jgi:hypothetical protein
MTARRVTDPVAAYDSAVSTAVGEPRYQLLLTMALTPSLYPGKRQCKLWKWCSPDEEIRPAHDSTQRARLAQ